MLPFPEGHWLSGGQWNLEVEDSAHACLTLHYLLWVGLLSRRYLFFSFSELSITVKPCGQRIRWAQWAVLYVLVQDSMSSTAVYSQSCCCSSLWLLAKQGSPPSIRAGLVSRNLQWCGWNARFILGLVLNAANAFSALGRPDFLGRVHLTMWPEGEFWWTCLEIPFQASSHSPKHPPCPEVLRKHLKTHLRYTWARRNAAMYTD